MSDHPRPDFHQLRRQILVALLPDLILSIVGPVLIYRLAIAYMPAPSALLLASVSPIIRIGIGLLRRRLNPLGVLSLLTIALKIFMALVLQDTRWMLVSVSLITGTHGLLMLASLLSKRPLLLWVVESVLANAPEASDQQPLRRLLQAAPRSSWTVVTAVLGVALLLECGVNILLASTLSVELFLVISPVVRYSLLGGALIGMLLFAWMRRSRKQKALEETSSQLPHETTHPSASR